MCCPVPSRVWRKSHARRGAGRNVPLAVGLGLGEGQSIDRKLDVVLPSRRSTNQRVEGRTRVTGLSLLRTSKSSQRRSATGYTADAPDILCAVFAFSGCRGGSKCGD